MFKELDHIAIVVRDTEEALKFYRDQMGLTLKVSEELEDVGVRLTHLDMGNVDLQLVQPLKKDHPLSAHLDQHGEGLHHLCWKMDDLNKAIDGLKDYQFTTRAPTPHSGTEGKKATFIDPSQTRGVLWEMTAEK